MARIGDHHTQGGSQAMDFETKFGPMLHPIRDLNKNWMVNLASYLEEYLEQFVQHAESSPELASLNFAQAAMLIQGSANIYSKKVEYVYSLTYQLYEQLVSKNKNKQLPSSTNKEGKDQDVATSIHEQFLSLDDAPESGNLSRSSNGHRTSFQAIKTPVPTTLIMLDDKEKGTSMLINMKGHQMGNRNDTSLNRCLLSKLGSLLSTSTLEDEEETKHRTQSLAHPLSPSHSKVDPVAALGDKLPLSQEDHENYQDAGDIGFDDLEDHREEPLLPLPKDQDCPQSTEKRVRNIQKQTKKEKEIMELANCFKLLDPHKESTIPNKPLKVMVVHRLPNQQKNKQLKRKRNKKEPKIENEIVQDEKKLVPLDLNIMNEICFSQVQKFPKTKPLKVPLLESIQDLFWESRKDHIKMLNERKNERLAPGFNIEESLSDDEHDLGADVGHLESSFSDEEAGKDLHDLPINQTANGDHNDAPSDMFGASQGSIPVVTTYEELAKEQIAKFHLANSKFQRGTDIGKRVNEWEERIQPRLEKEEERGAYDIHAYGSEILACFGDNNRKQSLLFADIVRGKEDWEVPRYFLSSLLLANCYNVEISADGVLEQGMDTMELTLLSRKRHHEELEEFRAPSAHT